MAKKLKKFLFAIGLLKKFLFAKITLDVKCREKKKLGNQCTFEKSSCLDPVLFSFFFLDFSFLSVPVLLGILPGE